MKDINKVRNCLYSMIEIIVNTLRYKSVSLLELDRMGYSDANFDIALKVEEISDKETQIIINVTEK